MSRTPRYSTVPMPAAVNTASGNAVAALEDRLPQPCAHALVGALDEPFVLALFLPERPHDPNRPQHLRHQ